MEWVRAVEEECGWEQNIMTKKNEHVVMTPTTLHANLNIF